MRPLALVGLIVLVFGILAFFVPIPRSNTHEAKIGNTSIGVTTEHNQKLSPAVGGVLCAVGAVVLIAGSRKSA